MKEEDYKHTWVLPKGAWWIRFYLWLWDANPKKVTFCRLFWGYAFAWVALLATLLIGIVTCIGIVGQAMGNTLCSIVSVTKEHGEVVDDKLPDIKVSSQNRFYQNIPVKFEVRKAHKDWFLAERRLDGERVTTFGSLYVASGKHIIVYRFKRYKMVGDDGFCCPELDDKHIDVAHTFVVHGLPLKDRMLTKIENMGSWISMQAKRPRVNKVLTAMVVTGFTVVFLILLWAAIIPAVMIIISSMPAWPHAAVVVVTSTPGIIGLISIAASIALGLLLHVMLILGVTLAIRDVIMKPAAFATKRGTISFGKAMLIGYKSVKGGTCPRVIIEDDKCS